nr:YadA [Salmonella enterica subsp. enterica serovar Rissen]
MLRFIFATVAHDPDPDLTPLAVKRLCKALFGRTGSQWLIVDIFGEKGGSAAATTATRSPWKRLPQNIATKPGGTGLQRLPKLNV